MGDEGNLCSTHHMKVERFDDILFRDTFDSRILASENKWCNEITG